MFRFQKVYSIANNLRKYTNQRPSKTVLECWNCDNLNDRPFFCGSCEVIQKPPKDTFNFFSILSLEPHYDLDVIELEQKYKDLQRKLHPDRYAQKSKKEKEYAGGYSAMVNEAYHTLKRPQSRARYLLEYHRKNINDAKLDMEFLSYIMGLREKIQRVSSDEELQPLKDSVEKEMKDLEKKISYLFSQGDLDLVVNEVAKMNYYIRLMDGIEQVSEG